MTRKTENLWLFVTVVCVVCAAAVGISLLVAKTSGREAAEEVTEGLQTAIEENARGIAENAAGIQDLQTKMDDVAPADVKRSVEVQSKAIMREIGKLRADMAAESGTAQ